jgi:glycerate-2-kinase
VSRNRWEEPFDYRDIEFSSCYTFFMNLGNRRIAEDIYWSAIEAVDPYASVRQHTDHLMDFYRRGGFNRLLVVGAGKASTEMAKAVNDALGDIIETGIVITKHGGLEDTFEGGTIRACEAGHPVPDEQGLNAAREIIRLLEDADSRTLVICLISGGGSALLVAPYGNLTLSDKQSVTQALLSSGADIHEVNTVRKHLSAVKGGRLAALAHPATVRSLIVSDVIGDDVDVIASGPTSPDTSTYQDALEILRKYSISPSASVQSLIEDGLTGKVPETPKEGDAVFETVENRIIANNRRALESARAKAEELGLSATVLTDTLQGDTEEAARYLMESIAKHDRRPACLISGGETTVKVLGTGKGGRNMHLALRLAMELEGMEGVTMLSAGTDGTDGPTDAAGAIVDGSTGSRALSMGLVPEEYLTNNDSYHFFEKSGDIFVTGATGTNVMDIQIILLT